MIGLLLKLIPKDYSWKVAGRKAGYMAGKALVALLAYTNAQAPGFLGQIGVHIDPKIFEAGTALLAASALEAAHDWARLRWPGTRWL